MIRPCIARVVKTICLGDTKERASQSGQPEQKVLTMEETVHRMVKACIVVELPDLVHV